MCKAGINDVPPHLVAQGVELVIRYRRAGKLSIVIR